MKDYFEHICAGVEGIKVEQLKDYPTIVSLGRC